MVLISLFIYFRLTPIINQTFPYTYDQGRDMLKVEQIIRYFKPTLVGPTTGIPGIFHGAWWYYFLSIPYVVFNGWPLGFVIFIFLINLFCAGFGYFFLKKYFDRSSALLFLALTTGSSYLIMMSSFMINGTVGFPFIILFFYSLYQYLKTDGKKYVFLSIFSIGLILESEVPHGIFLYLAFFISLIILRLFKRFFAKKNLPYAAAGFIIPIIPRVAFELLRNFRQSRTIVEFLMKPKYYNPRTFTEVVIERWKTFDFYYQGLFTNNYGWINYILFGLAIIGIIFFVKKQTKINQVFIKMVGLIIGLIFILSCFYKDNFWGNYLEGLSYYLALFLSIGISFLTKAKNKLIKLLPYFVFGIIFLNLLFKGYNQINNTKPVAETGIRVQQKVLNYLFKENNYQRFCLRIYTPPVIPYTYNYLLSYYAKIGKIKESTTSYVNNHCWYIIEDDPYKFRIETFRKEHIPQTARKIKEKNITKDVKVEYWQYSP